MILKLRVKCMTENKWINAQQQLSHAGQDPKRGLYVSFNGVVNDKATTFVQSTQQLALLV